MIVGTQAMFQEDRRIEDRGIEKRPLAIFFFGAMQALHGQQVDRARARSMIAQGGQ